MYKAIGLIFFILPYIGFAQVKSIGIPKIHNYSNSVYNAGTQNWGIAQDNYGFIYFANNDGLLQFDGLHWNLIEVSKTSPARLVLVDSKNNLYVGLINDFGIIKNSASGSPVFQSLRHLLPAGIDDFDDIWRIHEIQDGIVFQCFKYLFVLKNNEIKIVRPHEKFHFSFFANNKLIIQEQGVGVFEYKNGELEKLSWSEKIKDYEISAILATNSNQLLIGTSRNGIYKITENGNPEQWNTPAGKLAEKNNLFCATSIKNNYFAFGTILNGLVIADFDGNIKQQIGRPQGLQNNTVLSIHSDKNDNIWLGLDNGIVYLETNSPISFIANLERLGTGYCCKIFKGNLYFGTNQGLFVQSFTDFLQNRSQFDLVENSAGQVWSLEEFDGQLVCGHNLGAFIIDGKKAFNIGNKDGAWKFIQLKNHPDLLLGGHYSGLVLLKKGLKGWEFYRKLTGFNESSRYLCQSDDGTIWVGHGGKGIFRVTLSENLDKVEEFKLFTTKDGLPSNENNILFEFNGKAFISTFTGIFKYNNSSNTFEIDDELNLIFNLDNRLKTVSPDVEGNIWYISENESGVLRLNEDLTYTKITTPFKQLDGKYVNEFEFIYPYNDENIFIGNNNGFAHYSSKFPKSYSTTFQSFITKIELPYIDSTLNFNNIYSDLKYEFPFKKNAFRFHFSSPFFEESDKLEFSYFLENYSDKWSDWSIEDFKDFTNLNEGNYTFQLKARNVYQNESEITVFKFRVKPPWYRSSLAFYSYFIALCIVAFLVVKFVLYRIRKLKEFEKRKLERELKKKEKQFQLRTIIAEDEVIRLRNETLQNEVLHRDKELTNQTINIIEKNKFLIKLNEELQRIQSSTNDAAVITKIALIKKRILKEIDDKQQNKIFETYFDEVHNAFFKIMKEKYPDLSPKDLRLCAFIKMNISSKEISSLLNISYRGVEINRYRLRKKLDISREINLPTFLSNIT